MFPRMFTPLAAGGALALGVVAGLTSKPAANSTAKTLEALAARVEELERDLGIKKDENNYPILSKKHRSLMAKHLTPEMYAKYKDVKTSGGFTFDQAIQAGIDAPHLGVGMVAGDEESYEAFRDLFDLIIDGWHGYKPSDMHKLDIQPDHLKMTPEQAEKFDKHVVSTRIRAGRSIRGLPLPPGTNRAQRRKVEELISGGLANLSGDLSGKYYSLMTMTPEDEQFLIDEHFLFQKPSPRNVLANCGAARDWPDGRGIFHNSAKSFLVWVNEEDHMRVISMLPGGNVKQVFTLWAHAIMEVEKSIKSQGYEYMYNDHLGNVCCCPSNLGTGLRASVMLKLPKLYNKMGVHALEELCDNMGLQARGSKGEHSPPGPNGEFDISNKRRIGFSEVELIQQMIDGVDELIKMEEAL